MESLTLTNLLTKVRQLADCENLTVRYPDTLLTAFINDGYQAYRELIGGADTRAMRSVDPAELAANVDYAEITADVARVVHVAIQNSDNTWRALQELASASELAQATIVRSGPGTDIDKAEPDIGEPEFWWWEAEVVDSSTPAHGRLHLYPATTRTTHLHYVFIKNGAALVSGGDVAWFPVPRGTEYVALYAGVQLATRDVNQEKFMLLSARLQDLEGKLRSKARQYTGGTLRRRDTRGERAYNDSLSQGWPWWLGSP